MELRRLGQTDFELTPVGLGCMQFAGRGVTTGFYRPIDEQTATAVVRAALDRGVNWFDTAEMYGGGNSERVLTSALRDLGVSPGDVTIATKWPPLLRTASNIVRSVDDRLAALQGYPIDLHQIHMPRGSISPVSKQVDAMAEIARAGKISAVGVSNFSAALMERACEQLRGQGLTLASNQVQISALDRRIERNGLLESARRRGITLIAYAPLKSGLLTGRFHDDPELIKTMPRVRRVLGRFNSSTLKRTAPLIDELRAIAGANCVSIAQVALSWLITFYGDTVVAISGASKPHQAAESAQAMELELTKVEIDRIDELSRACGAFGN